MLTITVLDTATIYEGHESIFRYDLPGSGVVEGWALAGVIDQAEKSAGPGWPEEKVRVVADSTATAISEEAVSVIIRHLRMAGVVCVEGEGTPAAGSPRPLADAAPPASPPQGVQKAGDTPRRATSSTAAASWRNRIPWVPVATVGALAAVCACGLVLFSLARQGAKEEAVGGLAASASSATAARPSASLMVATPAPSTSNAQPERERIEAGGMIVDLPRGYRWTEENGLYTATGADPNLRILFAADPLYSVPAEALFQELRAQIDSDDTLSQPDEVRGRFSYLETPGDGSEVSWTTWVDKQHQLSVGCHTRYEPTLVHKAACRMARESLELQ